MKLVKPAYQHPHGSGTDSISRRGISNTFFSLRALLACMLYDLPAMAQAAVPNWLEDSLHGSAKMNTVVAVVAIILLGIGIWLFAQDRKLSRLEERMRADERRN